MNKNRQRGKRLDGCGWIYGSLLQNEDMSVIVVEFEESAYCGIGDCPYTHGVIGFEVDPETVGQYTGLKDKNGKKIYEGDIVELTNTYKGMNTKSIVEIDFIDFTFAGKWAEEYSPSGYMYNPLGSYNFPIVTIEVIGNIHDNPELIHDQKAEVEK